MTETGRQTVNVVGTNVEFVVASKPGLQDFVDHCPQNPQIVCNWQADPAQPVDGSFMITGHGSVDVYSVCSTISALAKGEGREVNPAVCAQDLTPLTRPDSDNTMWLSAPGGTINFSDGISKISVTNAITSIEFQPQAAANVITQEPNAGPPPQVNNLPRPNYALNWTCLLVIVFGGTALTINYINRRVRPKIRDIDQNYESSKLHIPFQNGKLSVGGIRLKKIPNSVSSKN